MEEKTELPRLDHAKEVLGMNQISVTNTDTPEKTHHTPAIPAQHTSGLLHNLTKKMNSKNQSLRPPNAQNSYVLTNICPKKKFTDKDFLHLKQNQRQRMVKEGIFGSGEGQPEEDIEEDLKKHMTSTTFRNIISVRKKSRHDSRGMNIDLGQASAKNNTDQPVFMELADWWRTHKNSIYREENDLVPINYDDKNSWEMLTNAIIAPESVEGRQWWEEVRNYKLGQSNEDKTGYQYLLSQNFPAIFKSNFKGGPDKGGPQGFKRVTKVIGNLIKMKALDQLAQIKQQQGRKNDQVIVEVSTLGSRESGTKRDSHTEDRQTTSAGKMSTKQSRDGVRVGSRTINANTGLDVRPKDTENGLNTGQARTTQRSRDGMSFAQQKSGLGQSSTTASQFKGQESNYASLTNMKKHRKGSPASNSKGSIFQSNRPSPIRLNRNIDRNEGNISQISKNRYKSNMRIQNDNSQDDKSTPGLNANLKVNGARPTHKFVKPFRSKKSSIVSRGITIDKSVIYSQKAKENMRDLDELNSIIQASDTKVKALSNSALSGGRKKSQGNFNDGPYIKVQEINTRQEEGQMTRSKTSTHGVTHGITQSAFAFQPDLTSSGNLAPPKTGNDGRVRHSNQQAFVPEGEKLQHFKSNPMKRSQDITNQPLYCSDTDEKGDGTTKSRNGFRSTQSTYGNNEFIDPSFTRAFNEMFNDKMMIAEILQQNPLTQKQAIRKKMAATRSSDKSAGNFSKSITNSNFYQTASQTPIEDSRDFDQSAEPVLSQQQPPVPLNLKFEEQSTIRDKFFDAYISNLQTNSSHIDKQEQVFIEKLLAQDRLIQKQMSLVQNYGKKQWRNTSFQQPKPVKQWSQTHNHGYNSHVSSLLTSTQFQPLFNGQYSRDHSNNTYQQHQQLTELKQRDLQRRPQFSDLAFQEQAKRGSNLQWTGELSLGANRSRD